MIIKEINRDMEETYTPVRQSVRGVRRLSLRSRRAPEVSTVGCSAQKHYYNTQIISKYKCSCALRQDL